MTAHAMQGDRERCLAAGMNGYVSKPVDPLALAEELEKWLTRGNDELGMMKDEGGEGEMDEGAESSSRVFDRADFLSRLMGDEELVREIIAMFLEDMPGELKILKGFVENGRAHEAGAQAHKIKGAAANVAGEALREIAHAMEQAGKAGDMEALGKWMPELETRFLQLKSDMETD